jgi:hypothetical protein
MASIRAAADASLGVGGNGGGSGDLFNLSSPAGWAMLWWGLSVLVILVMLMSL